MKEINKAIFEFQKEFPAVKKMRKNPFTKSMYASLDDIINIINPLLTKHSLFVTYATENKNKDILLTCIITHSNSGESVKSEMLILHNADPQKTGSSLTYYRRYTLCCLLNIVETSDDDGNGARPTTTQPITDQQKSDIFNLMEATETVESKFKAYLERTFNVANYEQLDESQAAIALGMLKKKLAQNAKK